LKIFSYEVSDMYWITDVLKHYLLIVLLVATALIAGLYFLAPTQWNLPGFDRSVSPSAEATVQSIRQVGELHSLQVRVEKVVDAESGLGFADFLFADRLLLVAAGQARFGVDLTQLTEEAIQTDGTTVRLVLPEVVLLDVKLDEEATRVFSRNTGWLRLRQDADLEREARIAAVRAIEEQVKNDLLYRNQARESAAEILTSLLSGLGFESITIE